MNALEQYVPECFLGNTSSARCSGTQRLCGPLQPETQNSLSSCRSLGLSISIKGSKRFGFEKTSSILFSHRFLNFLDSRMLGVLFVCSFCCFSFPSHCPGANRSTPSVILCQSRASLEMKSWGRNKCSGEGSGLVQIGSFFRAWGWNEKAVSPASLAHGSIKELSDLPTPAGLQLHSQLPNRPANSYSNPAFLPLVGVLFPTLMAGLLETHFLTSTSSRSLRSVPSVGCPALYRLFKRAPRTLLPSAVSTSSITFS